jgi:hypothetical protein
MKALELTRDELNEVHDALSYYVKQMISEGQTPQEIEYQSLASAWSAQQKALRAILRGADPSWVAVRAAEVQDAIARPKRRAECP